MELMWLHQTEVVFHNIHDVEIESDLHDIFLQKT